MKENKSWTKWIYWFTFAAAIILVYKTVDGLASISVSIGKFISVLMPFIMAVLLAYLFYIPCRYIERLLNKVKFMQKSARLLSILIVYIIAILLITLLLNIVIPSLSKSLMELANQLPTYYKNTIDMIDKMPEDLIIEKEDLRNIVSNLEKIDITGFVSSERISDYITGLLGVARTMFNTIVTIVVSIYILLERTRILVFIKRLTRATFKEKTSKRVERYFREGNEIFFKFISSQVLDSIIVGTISWILMLIMGVKYAPLLALMMGLFNMIPVVGAIVATVIAGVMTLLTGGITEALWLLAVLTILQQIDGNIINPKIVGNSLKLSPIIIIFAVTVAGAYFGVLGMFVAVPIVAVIKLMINDFIENKEKAKQ